MKYQESISGPILDGLTPSNLMKLALKPASAMPTVTIRSHPSQTELSLMALQLRIISRLCLEIADTSEALKLRASLEFVAVNLASIALQLKDLDGRQAIGRN